MYRVNCPSCGKPYNAAAARDCSCIQPVRSFQCPHCAACFCNAEKKFIDAFWADAPAEVWARRRAGAAPQQADPDDALRRPLVLFADDDATGRAIARQVIRKLGFGIVLAEDGETALDLAVRHKPELIVTDALMPRLDGREMARRVKADLPATRIVVITSVYKDPRYKHEALSRFEVDEYLAKPIKPGELRDVVTKYLGGAK